jgi:hypothetical protein
LAAQVSPATRLPLVSLVLPVLQALSPRQLSAFRNDVEALINADSRMTLFEYAVRRFVLHRLLPRLERKAPLTVRFNDLGPLLPACSALLSTLARLGAADDSQAARAFQLAVQKLGSSGTRLELLPKDQCSYSAVDEALEKLAAAAPAIKRQIIESCASCIGADGRVTVEEGEALRVICDALGCPMPPLLGMEA